MKNFGGGVLAVFQGAGVAIVTPFTEQNTIDFKALEELIEFQIQEHTDSIVVCGTTGEASTLKYEEQIQCIGFTVDKVKKRVPVIAGTGSNSTEAAIRLSKEAQKVGADGLLIVSPYYNKATQNGLIKHFSAIAAEVDLPIIMYNHEGRTGVNLFPKTVATIVKEVDNIIGIKEASGDISQVASIMELTEGNIDLYSGNDDQIVPILSLGGKGVISVLSNIAPRDTHDMVMKYLNKDVEGSREIQLRYLPLIKALLAEVNPIGVKLALKCMGKCNGKLRGPLTEMEQEHANSLITAMKKCGIIE